jgi:hypothetical protein
MSDTINSLAELLQQKPKVLPVDLPDMGKTVHILKGTFGTLRALDATRTPEGEANVPKQLSLILCNADGELLCKTDEEVEKLTGVMTFSDMNILLDKWQDWNGMTKAKQEQTEKN